MQVLITIGKKRVQSDPSRPLSALIPILGKRFSRARYFTLAATIRCTRRIITDTPIMRQFYKNKPRTQPRQKMDPKKISYSF
ncbi:MAG TPA: hypothetical protein VNW25_02905 [Candidatus Sulfotelmatobacter sp.]|nr:hypothetical protein [Candidatus Sulfotelmatobacter sp.]